MKPEYYLTQDFHFRFQRDLEEMQTEPRKASDANAYSWIKGLNKIRELGGNPEMILNVGCGWGRELVRFDHGIGIDIVPEFLKAGRIYSGPNKHFILADAHSLPFRNDLFDLAIMHHVIEHIEEPARVIGEVRRVLKNKGRLVASTPNKLATRNWTLTRGYGHFREFSPREFKTLLAQEGFRILKLTGCSTIPYIPWRARFENINGNSVFFTLWQFLDKLIPLKWDMVVLAEIDKQDQLPKSGTG